MGKGRFRGGADGEQKVRGEFHIQIIKKSGPGGKRGVRFFGRGQETPDSARSLFPSRLIP